MSLPTNEGHGHYVCTVGRWKEEGLATEPQQIYKYGTPKALKTPVCFVLFCLETF